MPDSYITFEHGEVRLADTLLPGEIESIAVQGKVRLDEAQEDTLSGKRKAFMGWDDSDLQIMMILTSDEEATCYERLEIISGLFRGDEDGKKPKIYTVTNAHARARGLDRVIFSGLDSYETNREDTIQVMMRFLEWEPAVVNTEKRDAASDAAISTGTPETNTGADVDTLVISVE